MVNLTKYRLPFFLSIIVFVLVGTFFAIKFTQGYRIDLSSKTLKPTGLLVVNSTPYGAQVYVNGKLMTATNNTLALPPGEYNVELKKNGFSPWQKRLTLKRELVTQVEAFLFPQVPDLKPLTYHATENPELSPDGTRVVYSIPFEEESFSTASATTVNLAGLWVMDLTDSLFNLGREPRQVLKSLSSTRDFSKAKFGWSTDGKQIWVEFSASEKYLIDPNVLNPESSLVNREKTWAEITLAWEKEDQLRQAMKMNKYPKTLQDILASSSAQLSFSPDGTKILYQATASAQIPENLIPPVLAASTQPESRTIEKGKYYVYDLKEDKNFYIPYVSPLPSPTPSPKKKVPSPTPTPFYYSLMAINFISPRWFPTSQHLYWIDSSASSGQASSDKVMACEYDGNNLTTIYSGPFVKPSVYVSPNADKLIILTHINFDESANLNLYSVSLR